MISVVSVRGWVGTVRKTSYNGGKIDFENLYLLFWDKPFQVKIWKFWLCFYSERNEIFGSQGGPASDKIAMSLQTASQIFI